MIVVIPFCQKDFNLARELLLWIHELGKIPNHDALMVADAGTQWSDCMELLGMANETFRSAKIITTPKPIDGWIEGANALFREAAIHCQTRESHFLWLEPDAIPLRPGWLDLLDQSYRPQEKAFMGVLMKSSHAKFPDPYMEGVGIYPADTWNRFKGRWNEECWILSCASISVPQCHSTPLIQMLWGEMGIATSFVKVRTADSAPQDRTLEDLDKRAVIYHRTKDSSLIPLLRQKYFPQQDHQALAQELKKNSITDPRRFTRMAAM